MLVTDRQTDGRTDRYRATAYTALAMKQCTLCIYSEQMKAKSPQMIYTNTRPNKYF